MFEGVRPFHAIEPYSAAKTASKGDRPEMNAKTYPPKMKEYIYSFFSPLKENEVKSYIISFQCIPHLCHFASQNKKC